MPAGTSSCTRCFVLRTVFGRKLCTLLRRRGQVLLAGESGPLVLRSKLRRGGNFVRGCFRRGKVRRGGNSATRQIPKLALPHTHTHTRHCQSPKISPGKNFATLFDEIFPRNYRRPKPPPPTSRTAHWHPPQVGAGMFHVSHHSHDRDWVAVVGRWQQQCYTFSTEQELSAPSVPLSPGEAV